MNKLVGGIEAGGTKFVCAIGSGPNDIRAEIRYPTTNPKETLEKAISFFIGYQDIDDTVAIGIASFGPVDLDQSSDTYGYITSTPKPGWSNTEFKGAIERSLDLPVCFDTDVNGALLGEHKWGAAQGLENAIYLTIGTGIGGGAMVNSNLVHGLVHPEMGHIILPIRDDDMYKGGCPYHGNCLEGLANGSALEERWGTRAENLSVDHLAWDLEAHYLAIALHIIICTLSPQRIILGGGVMEQSQLFPLIRKKVLDSLNGYVQHEQLLKDIDNYIVPPELGKQAGVLGAIALAQTLLS
jgi:fructokinase